MKQALNNKSPRSLVFWWGLFMIVFFSLLIIPGIIFYEQMEQEWLRAALMVTTSLFIPLGFALLFINSPTEKRIRMTKIFRWISFSLVSLGLFMKYFHFLGSNISIIIGVLWYCFAFGPLGLKSAYRKWRPFANSWHDTTLLSIANFIGINLLFLGFLFKLMHWPYGIHLLVPGAVLTLVSLWGWNQKFGKEIILRKEAEEKLRERNKEVMDSIHYARRIQQNLLPQERYLEKVLSRIKKSGS